MKTKICIPIMGQDENEVLNQAEKVLQMQPDLIEWRADYIEKLDTDVIENITAKLKNIIGNVKLVFTFRTADEGGKQSISDEKYLEICCKAAENCDYVDVEIMGHMKIAKNLIAGIKKNGAKVIGSNHHFDNTPSNGEIIDIMKKMEEQGADICKIAVMPEAKEDVERFMDVSSQLKDILNVPIITMSMGELGAVSRICTNITASSVSFAAGVDASAPGQVKADILRKLLKVNEGCSLKGNISLIGFMGTGKTTVSKALSKITSFKEIDVDAYIVENEGKAIRDIFKDRGEAYFRTLETNALQTISSKQGQIISCGGGAVLKDENVDILKKNGVIVLLTATPETIFDRVKDHTHRPILNNDMSLRHVKELMEQREPRYQSVANVKVNVDSNDRILTCYNIINYLEKEGYIEIEINN